MHSEMCVEKCVHFIAAEARVHQTIQIYTDCTLTYIRNVYEICEKCAISACVYVCVHD